MSDDALRGYFGFKCPDEEAQEWHAAAKREGISASKWARHFLNEAVGRKGSGGVRSPMEAALTAAAKNTPRPVAKALVVLAAACEKSPEVRAAVRSLAALATRSGGGLRAKGLRTTGGGSVGGTG